MPSNELDLFIRDSNRLISRLQREIESTQVYVRSNTDEDKVLGAHLRRIYMTAKATLGLCLVRNGPDASTLARSVLEHAVSVSYLCRTDSQRRCAAFVIDSLTSAGKAHLNASKHFPLLRADSVQAQKAIETGEQSGHQSRFDSQLTDLIAEGEQDFFEFVREILYPVLSDFAHPRANGMAHLAPPSQMPFDFRYQPLVEECESAALTVLWCTLLATSEIEISWGLDFKVDFIKEFETIASRHKIMKPTWFDKFLLPRFVPKPNPKPNPRPSQKKPPTHQKGPGPLRAKH